MSRDKKISRHLEEISRELAYFTYQKIKGKLEGEHYGCCSAVFDGMVRRGEIEQFDN